MYYWKLMNDEKRELSNPKNGLGGIFFILQYPVIQKIKRTLGIGLKTLMVPSHV